MNSTQARRAVIVAALAIATGGVATAALAAGAPGTTGIAGSAPAANAQNEMGAMPMGDMPMATPSMDGRQPSPRTPRHVRATLRDVQGRAVGVVDIQRLASGANQVSVQAWNLSPGFHGFHLHSVGLCQAQGAKPFASAGGHFNPTGRPEGMQAGALPVLLAGTDGRAQARFVDANFRIADLFGPTGSAVVVHSGPDNYANIPPRYSANGMAGPDAETMATGDSGTRVACGVLSPAPGAAGGAAAVPVPSATGTPTRDVVHF